MYRRKETDILEVSVRLSGRDVRPPRRDPNYGGTLDGGHDLPSSDFGPSNTSFVDRNDVRGTRRYHR